MSALPRDVWSADDYLAFERASQEKHEFVDGQVYLMTGASRRHNVIVFNLAATLRPLMRGKPYEAYASDMRLRVGRDFFYPDLSMVCDEPQFADDTFDTLLNPALIIEVLSPSTEQYDRGRKFEKYRALESLREYVLVAQDRPYVERYTRQNDGWLLTEAAGLDSALELATVEARLPLVELYDRLRFDEGAAGQDEEA
jgi:Uma2 family endonuclease